MRPPFPSLSPLLHRCRCLWSLKAIYKNVLHFRRNLSICPVFLKQYNYQKINHQLTVPPIILPNIWQERTLRIYFNLLSVGSMKNKGGVSSRINTCDGSCGLHVRMRISIIFLVGGGTTIIGSLASHIGLLDDEFKRFLYAGKLIKVCSWYKNLRLHVKTYILFHNLDLFYGSFAPLKWAHLPRYQIIGKIPVLFGFVFQLVNG